MYMIRGTCCKVALNLHPSLKSSEHLSRMRTTLQTKSVRGPGSAEKGGAATAAHGW